jgi:hypothetical protein
MPRRLRCEPPRERCVNSASRPTPHLNSACDLRFAAALIDGVPCARYRGVEQALNSFCLTGRGQTAAQVTLHSAFNRHWRLNLGQESNLQMWCPAGIISET